MTEEMDEERLGRWKVSRMSDGYIRYLLFASLINPPNNLYNRECTTITLNTYVV